MIARHIRTQGIRARGIAGLVKYITDTQSKSERVGDIRTTNCHSDRADVAMLEILNTQAMNTRAGADKNYHLMISFAPGESPAPEVLAVIEERICAAIGFAGHQRVSVVHHDTDNLHVHVAINKIHPQRYTIHEPFNAYHTLGLVCEKLEKEFGLQQVDHSARKSRGENGADDMERHADVESLLGWIKRECAPPMRSADTWPAMHALMRVHGLTLHLRANGLVISADSGVSVKASSVAREFSKANLEKRLGAFEAAPQGAQQQNSSRQYAKRPLQSKVNTSELHARYKDAQQGTAVTRALLWAGARERKLLQIEAAKRKGRLKRATIRLLSMPRLEKKLLYAVTSKTLREEIDAVNKNYLQERQLIYERYRQIGWADWLRSDAVAGNKEALAALRARSFSTGLKGNTLRGTGGTRSSHSERANVAPDSVTRSGTVIYHVGTSAVRDDGDKLKVSRGADRAGLEAALRLAIARYGDCITVNGSAAFKEQIARAAAAAQLPVRFDDDNLERRRRQLAHPLKPKEKKHENDSGNDHAGVKRRPDIGRDGRSGQAAASRAASAARGATATRATRHGNRHANSDQPHPGSTGHQAPPAARNGVRGLSELGVVHVTHRGEVLLPGHVPGHMEHQGAKRDHRVRRHLRRPGRLIPATLDQLAQTSPTFRRKQLARSGTLPTPLRKNLPHVLALRDGTARGDGAPQQHGARHAHRMPRGARPPAGHRLASLGMSPAPPGKPKVGRAGTAPPPASKDRLRPLSRLGGVTIGERGATTVPSPPRRESVPSSARLPTTGAVPRASDEEAGQATRAARAADKYIIEREQKRCNGFDIPKHSRYNFTNDISAGFAGIRRIDGQALALLEKDEQVFVLPVDDTTARRLKRVSVGQQLSVNAQGVIKTKGRSR